ncbi:MAG: methyltransferase domain-containing protein [Verrucomicrobiales bacterium]|nr:methyltransferase domain-containing protein [Verrucomicrobiales bacterium]
MDPTTIQYYALRAVFVADQYAGAESTAAKFFALAFPAGSRVLDIGCGSGRDLHALLAAGYDAQGVDASEEMLREAAGRYPDLQGRLQKDALPALETVQDASADRKTGLDGLVCWAVLMHLPEEQLFDVVFNLRRVLKPGGRLLISTPRTGPAVDEATRRDTDGRLFNGVTPENYHFLLAKVGFRLLNRWDSDDSLGRPGRTWTTQLFVLEGQASRSLETIEAILNRDKKDATYKPALFRALAELATSSYHVARWLPDGRVAIPLRLVADKWLEYYWPLFASPLFIPQKRGEKPGCLKPVAFRAELQALIECFRAAGGLSGFSIAYRSNALDRAASLAHRRLVSKLTHTIREGPVYYAGGGGSGTFEYAHRSRSIVLEADLWRELSVMGNWIADATILRWTELTAEISEGALKPSQVVDHLLTVPIPEREVSAARSVYAALATKRCVWTGRLLGGEFDVDHAIPFALWGNNDLWNLLPAAKDVNNQKRDRLPSRGLFQQRKECVVECWSRLREAHVRRFEFEIGKLLTVGGAVGGNWENRLFNRVAEAIEFTAIQRGVERWEPAERRSRARQPSEVRQAWKVKPVPKAEPEPDLFVLDPPPSDRFVTCVPFYELEAAAGAFGSDQPPVDPRDHRTWIRVADRRLTRDLFSIRVKGRSMEPTIPDGSHCLFRGGDALAGSRQSRLVLVSLRDSVDPETGGRLTVKRYTSEKVAAEEGGFRHNCIILEPLNPDFPSIVIEAADEGTLRVVGEFVGVIGEKPVRQPG